MGFPFLPCYRNCPTKGGSIDQSGRNQTGRIHCEKRYNPRREFNGSQERTFCFGLPGTIFNSRFSFYKRLPSYYQIEACCPSVVLQIPHEDYIALTDRSHPFAVWALHYAWYEQYLEEDRESTVHNGTAKERYLHMLKTRPMIVKGVSQRVLASYLGVTPEYLCRVKASILRDELKDK